ncbi:MAG: 50S ribosomal protein L17 [Parcubacteria group bacterium GW2011_GWB1_41_6]|nr:MAG: 50S ribosomal protein L17 [Parcubacteria group bacterium GW2011_GWB1_41_6]KKS34440.1 MAG: 50S ribosomal protein L17 [Parcubacteria group bacterium GW2011_GWC2_42_13]KKS58259.1 MAG: 50S ribosomal protein L17 [Parcubacteria group bacterium GW2011_GWA2_42_35]KKS71760.1 MAG: 50S ribosomal protein L17 [Parcubacteria group bacterium GW2011_GWF2_42_7]
MKHQKKGRKFGRTSNQRKALLNSLLCALIKNGKIKTTEAKAKELRPLAEKIITRSLRGDLASRRYLSRYLAVNNVKKLFEEIGPRYKERPGGYTRISKLPLRKSDGSKMSIIEFV